MKQRIGLFIYKTLTQAVIILGNLRDRLRLWEKIRTDRTFVFHGIDGENTVACCDCGLTHRYWVRGTAVMEQPIRPKGYDYGMRHTAEPSSPVIDESELHRTLRLR